MQILFHMLSNKSRITGTEAREYETAAYQQIGLCDPSFPDKRRLEFKQNPSLFLAPPESLNNKLCQKHPLASRGVTS
eukprot:1152248-Pelagomonas_calceolata.AAC.4